MDAETTFYMGAIMAGVIAALLVRQPIPLPP